VRGSEVFAGCKTIPHLIENTSTGLDQWRNCFPCVVERFRAPGIRAPDGSAIVPEIESACKHNGPASQNSNNAIFDKRETGFRFIAGIEFVDPRGMKDNIRISLHDLPCRKPPPQYAALNTTFRFKVP
jgi:hypothetical protein